MKPFLAVCGWAAIFAATSQAQPVITGLLNNYSFVQPGLPNYGIAQGSIFDIFGTGLANVSTPLQGVPLPTTLSGVSATVTVSGISLPLILYFVTPTQIAAILPSRTPTGTGQITVTNNGKTSAAFPILVVQTAFGILTLNGAGNGPGAMFDAGSHLLGFTNAVNPGEYITIWGTGIGPAPGDETQLQTQQDLSTIPIEVDIGGVSATIAYHGRSVYPGLDQINVVVPAGVQGCYVSVAVQGGRIVSNFASIPVAASGRTCSDPNLGLTTGVVEPLSRQASYTIGTIQIIKALTTNPPTVSTLESASAQFNRIFPANISATMFANTSPSLGSCLVYPVNTSGIVVNNNINPGQAIDAGPAINVSGPNGTAVAGATSSLFYFKTFSNNGAAPVPDFIPNTGGTFTFDNGAAGGPDVGAFTAKISVPAPLVWTNQSSIGSVNRAQGVTVTWSGGDPNTYVIIIGAAQATTGSPVGSLFNCSAPVSAQRFTVPATVLMSLPVSATVSGSSFLRLENVVNTQTFAGPKLDVGFVSAAWVFTQNLTYQ